MEVNFRDSKDELEKTLCSRFEEVIPNSANNDSHLVWRGKNLSAECLIQIGSVPYLLSFWEGAIKNCQKGLMLMSTWDFSIRGSIYAWEGLWEDLPNQVGMIYLRLQKEEK